MGYQWYPGHMTKAYRQMQEDMKLIDLVIELLDARIPVSSRNPDIHKLAGNRSRILILNKADLADEKVNRMWETYFRDRGLFTLFADARNGASLKKLDPLVKEACREKMERDRKRGIINRPVRAMVVGIPNVGKSTFINSFAKKAVAKTGNRPGVTKGKQWIRLSKTLELLDTPGILWPKFEDEKIGEHIAMIGSMNDEILHTDELALRIIAYVREHYPENFTARYGEGFPADMQGHEILERIGEQKSIYSKGLKIDYNRVANMVIDDFRSGRMGRISLEVPEELS